MLIPPLKTGLCTPQRVFLLCLFSNWSWLLQIFRRCFCSTYICSPCENIINIPQNSVCGTEPRNKRWGASHRAQAAAGCLHIHSSKPASLPTTTDLLHRITKVCSQNAEIFDFAETFVISLTQTPGERLTFKGKQGGKCYRHTRSCVFVRVCLDTAQPGPWF